MSLIITSMSPGLPGPGRLGRAGSSNTAEAGTLRPRVWWTVLTGCGRTEVQCSLLSDPSATSPPQLPHGRHAS